MKINEKFNMKKINVKNKKAYFKYDIIDIYNSGIILQGTEIKAIRNRKFSFSDSYCYFINNELFLKNFHISKYKEGTYNNHEEKRDRKLLLTKKELEKLKNKIKEKGLTIIPLKIYINDNGICKFSIGLCESKKQYDKRKTIKDKDMKREENRKLKI